MFYTLQFAYCPNVGNRLLNSILLHLNNSKFKSGICQITCLDWKYRVGQRQKKQKQKQTVNLCEGKDIATSDQRTEMRFKEIMRMGKDQILT